MDRERVLQNTANRRDAPRCIRSTSLIISGCTRVQPYNLTEILNFDTPWLISYSLRSTDIPGLRPSMGLEGRILTSNVRASKSPVDLVACQLA